MTDVLTKPAWFDFPAAHSMDTTWFAIDRDGAVAIFESGEAGAVPSTACDPGSPSEEIFDVFEDGEPIYDLAGWRAVHGDAPQHLRPGGVRVDETVLFLPDTPGARRLLEGLDGEITTTGEGVVYVGAPPDEALFADLHLESRVTGKPICLGCFALYEERGAGHVFVYNHTGENWVAAPYARTSSPKKPLTRDDVPDEILDNAILFDGRFAETTSLQPAEHWKCESWMPAWLATDGKTVRPFAGREDELDDLELDDEKGGLEVREAADATREAEPAVRRTESEKARRAAAAPAAPSPPPIGSFGDVPQNLAEDDWSDVMPRSEARLPAASAEPVRPRAKPVTTPAGDLPESLDAPEPPSKKPWWKFW